MKTGIIFFTITIALFISAVITGVYLQMFELGISLTLLAGIFPLIMSNILEQMDTSTEESQNTQTELNL